MTDVLKIALERRSKLQEEVDRLDDFIRMAETLMGGSGSAPAAASPTASSSSPAPAMPTKPVSAESEDSPMRAAARRLGEAEPRRAESEPAEAGEVPRPSIIRRGLAG